MKIIFNDNILDDTDFAISPFSTGFNYGEGFFTTIKVIDSIPENFEFHLKRLVKTGNFFGFDYVFPDFLSKIKILMNVNCIKDARIKIIIFKDIDRISYMISAYTLNFNHSPIKLTLSDFIRGNDPIYKYKTLNHYTNYTNSLVLFKDYNDRVLETGFANIFFIDNFDVITPPDTLSILPGTYRENLLSKKSIGAFNIYEEEVFVNDINKFQGAFITNSIRGIVPVTEIDNFKFSTDMVYKIMENI